MTAQHIKTDAKQAKAKRSAAFGLLPRVIAGSALAILLIGGVGGWAATAKLAGAVISPGIVVVDQNLKSVQHRDGGIVSQIAVEEGDHVEIGQVLFRLDDVQTKAEKSIVDAQSTELIARRARLLAERDGLADVAFPPIYATDPTAAVFAAGELRMFQGQLASRESKKQQLELGIDQINQEIAGLANQRIAKTDDIALVEVEYSRIEQLAASKLIESARVFSIRRDRIRLHGELGEVDSATARARTRSSELRLEILAIDEAGRTEAQRELSQVEARLQELGERSSAMRDRLSRTDIRAPISGTVNELNIHTVGGIIGPAEILATIVPINAKLKIEIRLSPVNIEQVATNSPARMRFSAFNQRTTPELLGTVTYVAPATTVDRATGERYYLGHVEPLAGELAKLGASPMLPGMPVEVYVQTEERTVASYLARPIFDQFNRAFRER